MDDFVAQRLRQQVGDRWTLYSVIGKGDLTATYLALDRSGQEAAVKVLHPEFGEEPELREQFMREAYLANRIQHPSVVPIVDHGAFGHDSAFLIMERLQGESLAGRARGGTLPVDQLLDVLDQALDALATAHEQGLVHGNLKPGNLFMTASGQVKVLDFGLAQLVDAMPESLRSRSGVNAGMLPYAAPERARGERAVDGRIDLFGLGATAFHVLTGRRIHEQASDDALALAAKSKAAPALRSVAPHVPEEVAQIIDLALAFDREARYPDARTMQSDVRSATAKKKPPFAIARLVATEQGVPMPASSKPTGPVGLLPPLPSAPLAVRSTSKSARWLLLGATAALALSAVTWAVIESSTPPTRARPEPESPDDVGQQMAAERSSESEALPPSPSVVATDKRIEKRANTRANTRAR
jgi:serine/threonine protein kinase